MKKIIILLVISVCLVAGFMIVNNNTEDKSKEKIQKIENKEKENENEEKVNDKEKNTNPENEKEINQENKITKKIKAIYFEQNESVVFDTSISAQELEDFLSLETKSEFENNTPIILEIQGSKIKNLIEQQELEVFGKYVGLVDSNSAEFSYNSKSFILSINENLLEKLENVNPDTRLSLNIKKNDSTNKFDLIDFK